MENIPLIRRKFSITKDNNDKLILVVSIMYLIWLYIYPLFVTMTNYKYIGRIIIVLLILLLSINKGYRHFLIKFKKLVFFWYAFIMAIIISTLFSNNPNINIMINKILFDIANCWIVYTAFMYLSFKERNIKILLWTLAVLALLNSSIALYGSITGQRILRVEKELVGIGSFGYDPITGRSGGLRGENYMGIWNTPALAFGLFFLFYTRKFLLKVIALVFAVVSISSLIVSLSRTSVLCGITVLMISFILFGKRIFRILIIFLFFLVIAYTFSKMLLIKQISYFSSSAMYHQVKRWSIVNALEDVRFKIWTRYLDIATEDPIWGQGPGYIQEEVASGYFVPHNSFLDVLVEYGIIGLCLYTIPFISAFSSLLYFMRKKRRSEIWGNISCTIFLGMTVGLFFLSNPFLEIIWAVGGMLKARAVLGQSKTKFDFY